jgi:hypothetical protein
MAGLTRKGTSCKSSKMLLCVCEHFRLVGTDIRKQTHKKAKSFVRRNLGGRSPYMI